ncbi:MAG: GNAT family N-acetyltransferase [Acidimicrobiales bacterium]|nr:GNAT family N-acetyltransferase [Acidimicrobiales bacterium]
MTVHVVDAVDLTTAQLHDLLKLRVDVFVVEQNCPYPELDGRDLEPGTTHLWIEVDHEPAATLRLLTDPGCRRIGRVATAAEHRGAGYAATLVQRAIGLTSDPIELDAQSYLRQWYERFGFVVTGDEFIEDGIAHVPMRREAAF